MTDLTGADLDLAVARVMLRDDIHIEADAWMQDGTCYLCRSLEGGDAEEFRPDQGGAAAWEVLEWVRRQVNVVAVTIESDGNGGVVCMVAPAMSFDGATIGRGPTDAIALCRAVVALGEAG